MENQKRKYSELSEERKRQIRRRRLRQKRRRQKRILLLCLIAIAFVICLIVGVFIFRGKSSKKEAAPTSAKAMTVGKEKEEETVEETPEEPEEVIPDRSGFAVDPAVPCGSFSETEEKIVYLTFDDGPSVNTQAVLDILDQYKIKATFFVTGMNPDYFSMIKVAYDKGHTIGMHTYSHDYAIYASTETYFNDLDQIAGIVREQIGYVPCFIRFPGGSSNTISANYCSGIMTALSPEVQARGYQYYDWNCSFGDGAVRPTNEVIACGTAGTEPNLVILAHDANGKETSVEALPTIIEHYLNLGYTFKALDRESYAPHHGIGN